MKVLVFPQKLIYGGSALTAVDLAARLSDRGHEVHVYAPDGPLRRAVEERRLPLHLARPRGEDLRWPSVRSALHLRRLARAERIDIVHTYEWHPFFEALLGPYLLDGLPMVGSILSMRVPRFMPRRVPLVVGTRQLRDTTRRDGRTWVELIEPGVDIDRDSPHFDPGDYRSVLGLPSDAFVVTIVARLDGAKAENARIAIDAVPALTGSHDVRVLIAGHGTGEADLRRRTQEVEEELGRPFVHFAGELTDPRPAYAVADVVLGMGTSVMRGLAFGKPAIVTGTDGYSELFTPETSGEFVVQGFWGLGDGTLSPARLAEQLQLLLDSPGLRHELGSFGRQFVGRFAAETAADHLEELYRRVLEQPPSAAERRGEVFSAMVRLTAVRGAARLRRLLR